MILQIRLCYLFELKIAPAESELASVYIVNGNIKFGGRSTGYEHNFNQRRTVD